MAREDLHFRLRIPEDLKKQIEAAAEENGRSMTAEMVARLEQTFRVPVFIPGEVLDRVQLYAERQSRSVNDEILRLLEREYPKQWDIDERMQYLGDLLAILQGGTADARIDQFIHDVQETVEGVLTGRVKGVSRAARGEIQSLWDQYKERLAENAQDEDYDEEEDKARNITGRPEKFAIPIPDPHRDRMYLDYILPPELLAELTKKLRHADVEGAVATLGSLKKETLEEYIREEALPYFEQKRFLERHDLPPTETDDPFGFTEES